MTIATVKYGNTVGIDGKVFDFVSDLEIVDVQNAKNSSVMTYTDSKLESSPGKIFNVNNLQRLLGFGWIETWRATSPAEAEVYGCECES